MNEDQSMVLILEDDFPLAMQWREAFEVAGYRVIVSGTAAAAIEVLKTESIDLLIADMMIQSDGQSAPQGGLSVLTHIRLYRRKHPPSIAVTGLSQESQVFPHIELLGASEMYSKPVDVAVLVESAAKVIAKSKGK